MGKNVVVAALFIVFGYFGIASAGWLDNAIDNAIERTGNKAVNEATDSAYDAAKKKAKDTGKGAVQGSSGQRQSARPSPGSGGPAQDDEHFIQPDDFFIADQPLGKNAWCYVRLAKMVTEPSQKTKGQAEFFQITDGRNHWTKHFWKSRIAEEQDVKLGTVVIVYDGRREESGILPPEKKEDARGHNWFMAKITDLSDTFKGYVTVSGNYPVNLRNLRVVTK